MKKGFSIAFASLILCFCCTLPVCADQSSSDDYGKSMRNSYGQYQYDEESYIPTRVSPVKVLSFPLMVVASPIVFPCYYANTKEPELSDSFQDYWKWIHYRVPHKVEGISKQEIGKPNFFSFRKPKKRDVFEDPYDSYIPAEDQEMDVKKTSGSRPTIDSNLKNTADAVKPTRERPIVLDFEQEGVEASTILKDAAVSAEKAVPEKEGVETPVKKSFFKRLFSRKKKKAVQSPSADPALKSPGDSSIVVDTRETVLKSDNKKAQLLPKAEPLNIDVATKNESQSAELDVVADDGQLNQKPKRESFFKRLFSKKKKVTDSTHTVEVGTDDSLLAKADTMYSQKQYTKAEALYQKVLKQDADNQHAQKRVKTISMILEMQDEKTKVQKSIDTRGEKSLPVPKEDVLTQRKIVSSNRQVYSPAIDIPSQSPSLFSRPISLRAKGKVKKLLKKGEKYYAKKKYEKALKYYFKVISYDMNNEQAQKMIKTISEIQRSNEITRSLDLIQS